MPLPWGEGGRRTGEGSVANRTALLGGLRLLARFLPTNRARAFLEGTAHNHSNDAVIVATDPKSTQTQPTRTKIPLFAHPASFFPYRALFLTFLGICPVSFSAIDVRLEDWGRGASDYAKRKCYKASHAHL